MSKILMKGNEAIGEAAIRAGCHHFFGYPITPQSELPEYLARRLPEIGGVYLQAENEIAAINMVYGAAAAGVRTMTSSSGPGISLKQEGISYLAGAELPCLIVNIMRGGPGLGGIQPSQSDYFQATKGGGHGDYRLIVLAPASVQEIAYLVKKGFDLADIYRLPTLILGDGILGQMMEAVDFDAEVFGAEDFGAEKTGNFFARPWAVGGKGQRKHPQIINSLYLSPEELELHNRKLARKYRLIMDKETRAESFLSDDAEIIIVAYGITARIAKATVEQARAEGIKTGVFRPITLWPFPMRELNAATKKAKVVLTVEMSLGQMVEDVRLALNGRLPVAFYGRVGGMVPVPRDILTEVKQCLKNLKEANKDGGCFCTTSIAQ